MRQPAMARQTMSRSKRPRSWIRLWPWLLVPLLLLCVFWQRQSIIDTVRLYGYDPPAPIVELADRTDMTPWARRLFYVNKPELLERSAFNGACSSRDEQTIVLGCYHPVDRGIFLFHVTDERLSGVDQVTAAHEMLHAGYDRLSGRDKEQINTLLGKFYESGLIDERIKSVINSYRKSEPNDIANEMHSIFGTEVATLTPELEVYYKKYFNDRSKVVSLAQDYQSEFTTRQNKVAEYDAQLANMKQQIANNNLRLESEESQINSLRRAMDAQRAGNDIESYNANVPKYNARVDAYNQLIDTTKGLVASYNQIVETRNQLAVQVTELAHSIDSSYQAIN